MTPSRVRIELLNLAEALLVTADCVHSNGQVVGHHSLMLPPAPLAVLVGE